MIRRATHDLDAIFEDDVIIDGAIEDAQREALRRHALLGQPVAVWRDGRVVEVVPDPSGSVTGEAADDARAAE